MPTGEIYLQGIHADLGGQVRQFPPITTVSDEPPPLVGGPVRHMGGAGLKSEKDIGGANAT